MIAPRRTLRLPLSLPFPTRGGLILATVAILTGAGCRKPPSEVTLLTSEIVEVTVRPANLHDPSTTEWKVRHAGNDWLIRTRIPAVAASQPFDAPETRAALQRNLSWAPPYLFIREANPHRDASRAVVDHVFRCTNGVVHRLGTLAAPSGPPGSQHENGRFQDVYDRLEFSSLAAPQRGPTFPIVLRDVYGRFRVDADATWALSQSRFQERLAAVQAHALAATSNVQAALPRPVASERIAQADTLFCLALARYCDRSREFDLALNAARTFIRPLQDLLDEIDTVVPGELAASRDEVLRANPALVNVFKESAEDPEELGIPTLPADDAVPAPLPQLTPATPPGLNPD